MLLLLARPLVQFPALSRGVPSFPGMATYARAVESRLASLSSGLGLLGLVENGWIWNITVHMVVSAEEFAA